MVEHWEIPIAASSLDDTGLQVRMDSRRECQNSMSELWGTGRVLGFGVVGVSDVRTQGSKTRLKLVCFALATGTGMSLYFGGSE